MFPLEIVATRIWMMIINTLTNLIIKWWFVDQLVKNINLDFPAFPFLAPPEIVGGPNPLHLLLVAFMPNSTTVSVDV